MKISLFQGILLGVFAAAALVGLFVFATYSSSSSDNGVGTVTIWGTLPQSDMEAVLLDATKINPTLKAVSYIQKDPSTLVSDLTAAIATDAAPQLVLASQEQLLSLAKFLTPVPTSEISARTFASTFAEEGELFATPDGSGYYGIPFLIDPLVLFENRTLLSSSGIAAAPTTWESLTGLVPHVATLSANRQVTRGLIALGTYDNVHDARGILSTLFLQTDVPIVTVSANGIYSADLGDAGTSASSGAAVVRFYTQFADPTKVSYTWNASLPDSQQAFIAGNLALYLGYASEATYFADANPNLDFDVAPTPQPATATTKNTYGLVYALMAPRGAANASGAYAAAALLTGTAEQAAAASDTGLAPATLAALSAAPASAIATVSYREALYAHGWLSPAPTDTDQVFSSMINSVNSGSISIDTAIPSAEEALSALLQQ